MILWGQWPEQPTRVTWRVIGWQVRQRWCFPRSHSQLIMDTPNAPIRFSFVFIYDSHPYEIFFQIFCRKSDQVVWHMLNHSAKMWIKFSKYNYQWITSYVFRTMPDGVRKARNLEALTLILTELRIHLGDKIHSGKIAGNNWKRIANFPRGVVQI